MDDYFIYGGLDSRDYGVWIFDLNTDTGAEYIQDEITVQGRHGKLLMPNGRFENLPHRYMGVVFEDAEARMTAFRDALMRYMGYQILSDSLHPDEFYQARYLGGIDPTVARGRTMVKFVIEFDRMPQRFLLDGKRTITYPPGIEDSKNLLPYPYYHSGVRISNGVTWTDNGDGTITADGMATSGTSFRCVQVVDFELPAGKYVLSGCPTGGNAGGSKYRICAQYSGLEKNDWGNGISFTLDEATDVGVYCYVYSGVTVNNLTFRPMIRNENLLPYPYSNTTKTENGITWTDNGDGTITVNGTSTAQTSFYLTPVLAQSTLRTYGEVYRIGLGVEGCSTNTYFIAGTFGDENRENAKYIHDLVDIFQSEYEVDTMYKGGYFGQFYIRIRSGVTVDNLTFKPMISLASETDPTWTPYYQGANTIYNPTNQTSAPIIRVYGYGELGLNGETITIASHSKSYLDIDSDMMDCYYGLENMNGYVTFSGLDFPVLKPGVNVVSLDENISRIEVKPRWWQV